MSKLDTLMVLIPALPLASAILTAIFGRPLLGRLAHVPAVLSQVLAFVLALVMLFEVSSQANKAAESAAPGTKAAVGFEHVRELWTWAVIENAYEPGKSSGPVAPDTPPKVNFQVSISLRSDPLTSMMMCMVTFVASLVAIYSIGYMHDDPGYWRFFTYQSLFVFSMIMLISVSNFALLYVFWEAVGLCSYLLVGFWYQKPEAAAAGKKAFLVNRIGDFGFALGVFLIWATFGTLDFHDTLVDGKLQVAGVLGQTRLANPALYVVGGHVAFLIALGLMTGAFGKSAQFPLHVWLPDAMEGPTPVSALIHAATMVTAGVYLLTRCTPLFSLSVHAQTIVACIGGFTALMAGIIAVTQTDLKRVLAYSTVSQLGYMFLALGTGSLSGILAGMFHLFTHAFFKALLFLGAGSVMHAMHHVIDMRRFSGLRRIMPVTHWTFWFGCLALSGIFPFAGFWSKDAILAAVDHRGHHGDQIFTWLFYAGTFTAFLTAFYTFRALFMTFYGETRVPEEAHHAHESPRTMTVPLVILAFCALVVGFYFEMPSHHFGDFLANTPSLRFAPVFGHGVEHEFHMNVAVMSSIVALAGVGLAAYFYLGDRREITRLAQFMQSIYVYQLSYGKFFIDEIYDVLIVGPFRMLANACAWIDHGVIDGLVNLFGAVPKAIGSVLRTLQTGLVQFYALAMVLGVLVLIGTLLIWPIG